MHHFASSLGDATVALVLGISRRRLGSVALVLGMLSGCPAGTVPPPPTSTPDRSATIPAVSELADAATVAVGTDAATSDGARATDAARPDEALSLLHRPDPGPGRVSCGDTTCEAGKETCAPRLECTDRKDFACVPTAALKARKYQGEVCENGCFSWFDQKACDGPSDCKTGEVCCYDADLILGPCDDGDNGMLDVYECKPATGGRTPCGTAEICSAKDPKCQRPGSTCIVDPKSGVGTCVVQRRMACGAAPCAAGALCVEWYKDGSRSCVKERPPAEEAMVVECSRGRDCAPDEGCFEFPGGHRCDLSEVSWAGQDVALCDDASDCAGLCGKTDAVCYEPGPGERKLCECRPPCKRTSDCKKSSYCPTLSLNRYGGALIPLEPYCDTAKQRCNCREPSQP
jgi:hypothetical protein